MIIYFIKTKKLHCTLKKIKFTELIFFFQNNNENKFKELELLFFNRFLNNADFYFQFNFTHLTF